MSDIEVPDLYELPETPERREPGWIDGPGRAAHCMGKVRKLTLRRKEIERTLAEHIAEFTAWAEREYARLDPDIAWHKRELERYALIQRAEGAGKTVDTPWGRVATRVVPPRWSVDMDVAIKSAKDQGLGHLVKATTTEKLDMAKAKNEFTVTDDGIVLAPGDVVIDGITVDPAGVSATVTPDLSGGAR